MEQGSITDARQQYLKSATILLGMLIEKADRMRKEIEEQDMNTFCRDLDLLAFGISVDSAYFEKERSGALLPVKTKSHTCDALALTERALLSIMELLTEARKRKINETSVEQSMGSAQSVIKTLRERLHSATVSVMAVRAKAA